jgi:hypothetical protein
MFVLVLVFMYMVLVFIYMVLVFTFVFDLESSWLNNHIRDFLAWASPSKNAE